MRSLMTTELERTRAVPVGRGRRHAVIMFADLSDSSGLSESIEAEELATIQARVHATADAIVERYGGIVIRMQGDGILAVFGHQEAREDDGRRAVDAALDLHAAVQAMNDAIVLPVGRRLRLHTGIHAGLVFIREGGPTTGRLEIVGQAANLAGKLEKVARPHEVLITTETLGTDAELYETINHRLIELPGIQGKASVCRVVRLKPDAQSRFEIRAKRGISRFVGREDELAELEATLNAVLGGKLQAAAIIAEPGLGKSRLAESFITRAAAAGVQVLRGHCDSYVSAQPMQPFVQILRTVAGIRATDTADLVMARLSERLGQLDPSLGACVDVLARLVSERHAPRAAHEAASGEAPRVPAALRMVFDALSQQQPVLVYVDDWQWSDDASREVLAAIAELVTRPIMILVTTRERSPGKFGLASGRAIELPMFEAAEADRMIAELMPRASTFEREAVRERAGGSPLLIEELCRLASRVADWQSLLQRGRGEEWFLRAMAARLDRLSQPAAELLRIAAIYGTAFPAAHLRALTGEPADGAKWQAAIAELQDEYILTPDVQPDTFRFRHAVLRDVIYPTMALTERSQRHLAIAAMLTSEAAAGIAASPVERLAYHYAAGGWHREAAKYSELAAEKAAAAKALDRVQLHCNDAIRSLDELIAACERTGEAREPLEARWLEIAKRIGLACVFDPSLEQQRLLERALAIANRRGHRSEQGYAEFWCGYVLYALGDTRKAFGHLFRAEGHADAIGDVRLRRYVRATRGQVHAASGQYEAADALLDEAINSRRERGPVSKPAVNLAYTLACKASLLADRGRFRDAHACFNEALYAVRDAGHEVEGSVLCWRAGVELWQGDWAGAMQSGRIAAQVGAQVRSLYLHGMGVSLGAFAKWKATGAETALERLADASDWLEKGHRQLFISLNHGWLTEAMAATEQWPLAREYAARGLWRARAGDHFGEAMTCRAMARVAEAGQARKPFEHYLRRAHRNATMRGSPHEIAKNQLCEAEIRALRGERQRARALLDQAAEASARMELAWHLGECERIRRLL